MKVYHGSPTKGLSHLVFKKEHSRFYENLVEGEGIYLTEDYEVAKGYASSGGSIYHVKFISGPILDATKSIQFEKVLSEVSQELGIKNLATVRYVHETIESVIEGSSSISKFGKSIQLIIDNDEKMMPVVESRGGYDFSETVATEIQKKIDEFAIIKYVDRGINNASSIIYIVRNADAIAVEKEESV